LRLALKCENKTIFCDPKNVFSSLNYYAPKFSSTILRHLILIDRTEGVRRQLGRQQAARQQAARQQAGRQTRKETARKMGRIV